MHDVYNKLVRGSSKNTGCAQADKNLPHFQEISVQDLLLDTLPTEKRAPIQIGRRVRSNLKSIGNRAVWSRSVWYMFFYALTHVLTGFSHVMAYASLAFEKVYQ